MHIIVRANNSVQFHGQDQPPEVSDGRLSVENVVLKLKLFSLNNKK